MCITCMAIICDNYIAHVHVILLKSENVCDTTDIAGPNTARWQLLKYCPTLYLYHQGMAIPVEP